MHETSAEGKLIQLAPEAVAELRSMLAQPGNAEKVFRVYIEKGGCSGMQYGMVFDEQRDGDTSVAQDGVTVVVDAFSAPYLRGSHVEFSDALTGGGFKITNPNARQSCGCGKSFQT